MAAPSDPRLALLEQMAAEAAAPSSHNPDRRRALGRRLPHPAIWRCGDFLSALPRRSPRWSSCCLTQAQRLPELRDALKMRRMLATNDADGLKSEVLGRIMAVSAGPAWDNYWGGVGHAPITARS